MQVLDDNNLNCFNYKARFEFNLNLFSGTLPNLFTS